MKSYFRFISLNAEPFVEDTRLRYDYESSIMGSIKLQPETTDINWISSGFFLIQKLNVCLIKSR